MLPVGAIKQLACNLGIRIAPDDDDDVQISKCAGVIRNKEVLTNIWCICWFNVMEIYKISRYTLCQENSFKFIECRIRYKYSNYLC
jgi:hypothetical protein